MRVQLVLAAVAISAAAANAQTNNRGFVKITTRDTTGAVVPSAEITIRSGLKDVVTTAMTDEHGQILVSFPVKDSSDFQVTARKIGYARGDRFFEAAARDTAVVDVIFKRPAGAAGAMLDAVKVTAKAEQSKYNSYDLYADEIENANGFLDNGWEVVKALRPVMLTSRGGCATGAQEVWVNGKRIRLPLRPTGLVAARAMVNAPIRARVSYVPISVLSEIAPEHIAEIHYHDCFDTSMAAVGNNDAIFVVLKPGVVYQQDVGSFVVSAAEEAKYTKK
jgi:hypothetical protein